MKTRATIVLLVVLAAGCGDRTAVERGWPLRELTRTRATLEDVFHRITLGDDEGAARTTHSPEDPA